MEQDPGPPPRRVLKPGRIALWIGAVALLVLLFYPFDPEPGVRWGFGRGLTGRPDWSSYCLEPRSAFERMALRVGINRCSILYVHVGAQPGVYPRLGVRGREAPWEEGGPLYEIWMDAEAERRVLEGEYRQKAGPGFVLD